ncbi:hypothetical protein NQ317_004636 [Molorchus minor]|uniref:Uncharacterized protein n=1 Tax=Molorchus minor TaxID=1323400 RepID=A0ABQ9IYX0_9CUCU|nr:hypothetical protein NQ317_004636 [Molorchus minor]
MKSTFYILCLAVIIFVVTEVAQGYGYGAGAYIPCGFMSGACRWFCSQREGGDMANVSTPDVCVHKIYFTI